MFPTFLAQEKTELALFIQGSAAKLAATHFLGNSNILHLHFFWEIVANPLENGSPLPSTKSGNCDLTGHINSPPPPPSNPHNAMRLLVGKGRAGEEASISKMGKGRRRNRIRQVPPFPKEIPLGNQGGSLLLPTCSIRTEGGGGFPLGIKLAFPLPSTSQPTLVPSPQPPPLLRDTLLLSLLLLIIIFAVEAAGRNSTSFF